MTKAGYPHKPPAPSVRQHIGSALERARGLAREKRTLTRDELVEEVIAKLPNLPATLRAELRYRAAAPATSTIADKK